MLPKSLIFTSLLILYVPCLSQQDCTYLPGYQAGHFLRVTGISFDECCSLCYEYQNAGCVGYAFNIETTDCELRDSDEEIDVTNANWFSGTATVEQVFNEECGDCVTERTGPGCSNADVEDCVCFLDPFCCQISGVWDKFCIEHAVDSCFCGSDGGDGGEGSEGSDGSDGSEEEIPETIATDSPTPADIEVEEEEAETIATDSPTPADIETESPTEVEEEEEETIATDSPTPADIETEAPTEVEEEEEESLVTDAPSPIEATDQPSQEEVEEEESADGDEEWVIVTEPPSMAPETDIPTTTSPADEEEETIATDSPSPIQTTDPPSEEEPEESPDHQESPGEEDEEDEGEEREEEGDSEELTELEESILLWENCNIPCYSYQFSTVCDCPDTDPIQVDVVTFDDGNTIAKNPQSSTSSGGGGEEEIDEWRLTVPELFDFISDLSSENDRISVDFDEDCGYPISIRYYSSATNEFISHLIYFTEKDCDVLIPILVGTPPPQFQQEDTSSPTPTPFLPSSPEVTAEPTPPPPPPETARPTSPPAPVQTSHPTSPAVPVQTSRPTSPSSPTHTSRPTSPPAPDRTSHPTPPPSPDRTSHPTPPPTPSRTSQPTNVKTSAPRPAETARPTIPPSPVRTSRPTNVKTASPRQERTNRPTSPPAPVHTRAPRTPRTPSTSEPLPTDQSEPDEEPEESAGEEESGFCSIEVSGRVGSYTVINGIYDFIDTVNTQPYYQHQESDLFIYWAEGGWRLGPRLGASVHIALVLEVANSPEEVEGIWSISDGSGEFLEDENVEIHCIF